MTQGVKHLPRKHVSLSSNPVLSKKEGGGGGRGGEEGMVTCSVIPATQKAKAGGL
jgi:hypothetical protein